MKFFLDTATMPCKVLMQLLNRPLTDIAWARFLKNWETVRQPAHT